MVIFLILYVFLSGVVGNSCSWFCSRQAHRFTTTPLSTVTDTTVLRCSQKCIRLAACSGYNFYPASGQCELVDTPDMERDDATGTVAFPAGVLVADSDVTAYSASFCTGTVQMLLRVKNTDSNNKQKNKCLDSSFHSSNKQLTVIVGFLTVCGDHKLEC